MTDTPSHPKAVDRVPGVAVYHFLSSKYALEDLEARRLKIAQFDDLNDPYELLALELTDKALRGVYRRFLRDMARQFGVICFSNGWHNPLLWSHYADKHRGICLGFEVPTDCLMKVKYTAHRLANKINTALSYGGLNEDDIQEILSAKFKGWKYEDESRIFLMLEERDPTTGLYFTEFGNGLRLREVILGPRCKVTKAHIFARLRSLDPGVRVLKARLDFTQFGIVKAERAR